VHQGKALNRCLVRAPPKMNFWRETTETIWKAPACIKERLSTSAHTSQSLWQLRPSSPSRGAILPQQAQGVLLPFITLDMLTHYQYSLFFFKVMLRWLHQWGWPEPYIYTEYGTCALFSGNHPSHAWKCCVWWLVTQRGLVLYAVRKLKTLWMQHSVP